ncbi:MAG: 6-phosphogluconolactonase [Acidobacteriota bacterium]
MSDLDSWFPAPEDAPSVLEARFDSPNKLADALAESLAADLRVAIQERGEASLVVSGGSTPVPLFAGLARQLLPWHQVTVLLADERWVDPGHDASNEGLVRRHLLVDEAEGAQLVGLKNDAATPEEGWEACEAALTAVPRPFDVVVLGMGADGHTASLFPGAPELGDGLDPAGERLCLPVRPPGAPHPRMSLSLAALLASRRCVVHITGDEKWRVYRRALAKGPVGSLPIRAILARGREPIDVYWAP